MSDASVLDCLSLEHHLVNLLLGLLKALEQLGRQISLFVHGLRAHVTDDDHFVQQIRLRVTSLQSFTCIFDALLLGLLEVFQASLLYSTTLFLLIFLCALFLSFFTESGYFSLHTARVVLSETVT